MAEWDFLATRQRQSGLVHNRINSASKEGSCNKYQQAEVKFFYLIFRTEDFFLVLYKNYK